MTGPLIFVAAMAIAGALLGLGALHLFGLEVWGDDGGWLLVAVFSVSSAVTTAALVDGPRSVR